MSVVSMLAGATTPMGATFVAKVSGGGPVRVLVSEVNPPTLPENKQVTIRTWGAQGGGGGLGGYAEGTFDITPGTTLNVRVGGEGAAPTSQTGQSDPGAGFAGGFNGGGTGGYYFDDFNGAGNLKMGGSGGGASDVRWDGDTLADRKIVGGGGGGAATHAAGTGGDGGGTTGEAGGSGPITGVEGGGGGTAVAGGDGGDNGGGTPGGDGTSGAGGAGGVWVTLGNNGGGPGGGGGGLFGGGGGTSATPGFGEAGGGGGGSGFVDPGATATDIQTGVREGDGRVEIEADGVTTVFTHTGSFDTYQVPGTGSVFTASQAVDAQGVAKVSITGLAAGTRHFWRVEDNGVLDTSQTGQFQTLPVVGSVASFTLSAASCAGATPLHPGDAGGELDPSNISNTPTWETIRALDPLMHVNIGDWGYPDYSTSTVESLTNRRRYWDDNLAQSNQKALCRDVPIAYAWDDHDFANDNSDGTYPDKANALQVYGERMPHYPLDGSNGIYQSWQIGRVLFVLSDTHYNRSPNTDPDGPAKTMLGAAQKTWLDNLLATSSAEVLVWLMPSQWLGSGGDTWGSFATERDELAQMLTDRGFAGRTVMVYGDRHAAGIDSGGSNPWGGFPILMASSIDSTASSPITGLMDVLDDTPGRGQRGTIAVSDLGNVLTITLSAWRNETLLGEHRVAFGLSTAPSVGVATVQEFAPLLGGSHTPVFEARVLTSFQFGPDPAGVDLPIVDGDVQFDATAKVHATLALTTQGVDPTTGRPWFPRLAADLLAPYGNEIFARRGVDLGGGGKLWSPLGIFRIETVEQGPDIESTIVIGGSDRMAGIIEADVFRPREFAATTPVSVLFETLVGEVFPDAVIIFDDESGSAPVGRQIVVDQSRYEPLLEVADGLGKVMFWDGQGFLRIQDPPDETAPVWTVAAGRDGVLVEVSRRLSRRGAPNGVLVIGEGGSAESPVRGVAVDAGPRSPTRWGGRYGRVLAEERLATVTTPAQAEVAARQILARRLGVPHSADFGAIVNPALRPRDPIVVVQRDGNRDRHIMQSVTLPLTARATMSGTTRERTTVVIGNVIT